MRAAPMDRQGHFGKVSRAIRKIHSSYQQRLNVEALAQGASMSVPSLHLHFPGVTDSPLMQNLKSTRLLMLRNDISAAFEVGCESASQFSREFNRFFGRTSLAEIRWMKATHALPAPAIYSLYA